MTYGDFDPRLLTCALRNTPETRTSVSEPEENDNPPDEEEH